MSTDIYSPPETWPRAPTAATRKTLAALVPIGRTLYALIFLMAPLAHFSHRLIDAAAAKGVPLANLLVPLAGVLAFVGGLCVALGYSARVGAWLLVLFLVPVTLVMHRFWGLSDPAQAAMQQVNFMKNLGLLGGALLIAWFGSGPYSLDELKPSDRDTSAPAGAKRPPALR